jgi:hypothetical protein
MSDRSKNRNKINREMDKERVKREKREGGD